MRIVLKIGGSLMEDLPKVRSVLDLAMSTGHWLAVTVGTGYPFKWHSQMLRACGIRLEGRLRLELSVVCQEANELTLKALHDRLEIVSDIAELSGLNQNSVALLRARSVLENVLQTPMGADCKALLMLSLCHADTLVLVKSIPRMDESRIHISQLRRQYPELLDPNFEEYWPKQTNVWLLTGIPEHNRPFFLQCCEITR